MRFARLLPRLAVVALLALPAGACKEWYPLGGGPIDVQWSMLRVNVQNAGPSALGVSYNGGVPFSAAPGQTVYLTSYYSTSGLPRSDSFAIRRESAVLVSVSFQPLQFPAAKSDTKDTTIYVDEPSPGTFVARAAEPDWIRIISVTAPGTSLR